MNSFLKFSTPLTIGAFILMATTGVLMFFHLDIGLNSEAHEWLSWVFLAGVVLHVTRNLKSFQRYWGQKSSVAVIAVFLAILTASFFIGEEEDHQKPPMEEIVHGLEGARIETLAGITGETPDELVARLSAHGYKVTGADQTLNELADDPEESIHLLESVFKK